MIESVADRTLAKNLSDVSLIIYIYGKVSIPYEIMNDPYIPLTFRKLPTYLL